MPDQTQLSEQEIEFLNSIFDLAREGKPVALKSLLDQGVPVNLTNAAGDTLLTLAAYHEHLDVVRILVAEGIDIEAMNDRGQTALICSVFRNNTEITRFLLDAGAQIHAGAQPPLQVAEMFGLPEMTDLLTKYL